MAWTTEMTAEMRIGRGGIVTSELPDTRDLRDPNVMGHRLLKLRDSDELKAKYPLSQVYDFFWE